MADTDKHTLEKISRLYTKLRELQHQADEVAEEIGRLLAGEEGIGAKLKRLEGAFAGAWETRYPGHYVWAYVKDRPQMKRLALKLDVEDLISRFARYLRDDDAYLVKARHPFALFVSQVNRYAGVDQALSFELDAPNDCRHTPRCQSDQEHTKKRAVEIRTWI